MATDQCYIALPKSCIGIFHCKARIESQLMQSIMPVGGVHGLSAQDGALRPKLEHQRVRILSPEFRGGGRHHVAVMAQAMAARGRRCCGTKSFLRRTGHVHSSTPVAFTISRALARPRAHAFDPVLWVALFEFDSDTAPPPRPRLWHGLRRTTTPCMCKSTKA